jgi:heterodisulfide reductase subunit B
VSKNETVQIPLNNYYIFKSCIAGSIYPGIEIAVKYILDKINADHSDDSGQSSCTGFGFFKGVVPIETNLTLNARNLSLAAKNDNKNVVCICPTSYNNLKHTKKLISKEKKVQKQIKGIFKDLGLKYDYSPEVSHISDVLLAKLDKISKKATHSLSGIKAITHHGCHYSKFFFNDVSSGNFENPKVLDDILKKFGCEVLDYSEKFLCCGGGLHNSLYNLDYPREVLMKKLKSIYLVKPDVIITQCPGCTFNLEYYQESISKELGSAERVPVLYISEMIALLLGEDPQNIGIDMHVVPVEPFLEKLGMEVRY